MHGYTKLFNSILHSTIWNEPNEVRILWITMLAMADKYGDIHASIPGLARMAGISIEQTQDGLKRFMSPDLFSRTPDHEGKRIKEIEGGWQLLNHGKYRALMSVEERREYNKVKQREWRSKNNLIKVNNVNDGQLQSTTNKQCQHITDTDTKAINTSLTGFDRFWDLYPRKKAKGDAIKAWKKIDVNLHETIFTAINKAKTSFDWQKDKGKFIPYPASWLNSMGWEDDLVFQLNGYHAPKPQEKRALTDSEASYEALMKLFKEQNWQSKKNEAVTLYQKLDMVAIASLPFDERKIIMGWVK